MRSIVRSRVLAQLRLDLDEGVAEPADLVGERLDRGLDLVGVVDLALPRLDELLQLLGAEILERRVDLDLAELVLRALLDREGDEELLAVGRQLGDGRDHLEVGVAARVVEAAQQLLVEREAVRVVGVVGAEEPVPSALLGLDHPAQRAVAELLVADEGDAADPGHRALVDLEHEVDPVLVELDDLGLDLGRVAAVAAVELEDAADGVLHARAGVDHARPELDLGLETSVVEPLVALEGDAVDDRVLDHPDDQDVALALDRDVVEQAGGEQALERVVDPLRVERVAGPERQ